MGNRLGNDEMNLISWKAESNAVGKPESATDKDFTRLGPVLKPV